MRSLFISLYCTVKKLLDAHKHGGNSLNCCYRGVKTKREEKSKAKGYARVLRREKMDYELKL